MSEERPTGWEGAERWFATPGGDGGGAGDGGGGDGDGEPPADAEGTPPPIPRCGVCGAELEHDQTYCLECGSPTPLAPRLRRGRRGAAILAGAVAVLGLGAGALAYAVAEDGGGGSAATGTAPATTTSPAPVPLPPETGPATGPLPPDTSLGTVTLPSTDTAPSTGTAPSTATGFETVTGPSGTLTTTPSTTDQQTTTDEDPVTEPDTGDSDWPAGTSAWTAILASVRSESDARSAKSRVAAEGEPAGVLFSSDFPDLRSGYWVVFSGSYPDRGTAIAQATKLRPDFPGAYARRIEG